MRSPTASELLDAWEAGGAGQASRAAALLGIVHPDAEAPHLLELPLGQRNRALLRLHAGMVGPRMECVLDCPACGERLDLTLRVADLEVEAGVDPPGGIPVEHGDVRAWIRLPTTADLLAAASAPAGVDGRETLARRCLLRRVPEGEESLPAGLLAAISEVLQGADPQSDMSLELTCPHCAHQWEAVLEPVDFLWRELAQACAVIFAENDALARVYHWSEPEILALSPPRRRAYLDLVLR